MKRPGIPAVPPGLEPGLYQFLQQTKAGIETLSGQRGTPISKLSTTATPTNAQLRDKINEIIDWLSPT